MVNTKLYHANQSFGMCANLDVRWEYTLYKTSWCVLALIENFVEIRRFLIVQLILQILTSKLRESRANFDTMNSQDQTYLLTISYLNARIFSFIFIPNQFLSDLQNLCKLA